MMSVRGAARIHNRQGGTMASTFEIKKAKDGQFYFHLKDSNGQIILASEMYKEKGSAENGIASVKKKRCRRRQLRTQGLEERSVYVQPEGRQSSDHRHQRDVQKHRVP
jgi:uncharacterized protein YegP (UPF0339 family)